MKTVYGILVLFITACGSEDSSGTSAEDIPEECKPSGVVQQTQPILPPDWQARANSWPATEWATGVYECNKAADAGLKKCNKSANPVLVDEYCKCVITGFISLVYYPNLAQITETEKKQWPAWCAYKVFK